MSRRMPIINALIAGMVLVIAMACTVKHEPLTYDTIPKPTALTDKEIRYGRYLYHKMCERYPHDAS